MYAEFMNAQIVSRRRFLATTSLAASAIWINPRGLFAQSAAVPPLVAEARVGAAKAEIRTQSLRGNVSALLGSGGNIAVLPGKDGKVLIDAGFASSQPKMEAALAAISGDPMTHLINTHWHFDHTDGNEWMHAAGATIVAHENTKKRLSTTQRIAAFDATFPPSPAGAIPTETLTEKKVLTLNGTTLVLEYYGPAHTDTDISIHFPDCGRDACGGHVVQRILSVHRQFNGRKHQRDDSGDREESCGGGHEDDRDSGAWAGGR